MTPSTDALVMQLTDGRFPSGGHAYSAGMEQAVTWGDVHDLDTAEAFAEGRAATSSIMAAQVTAAANVVCASAMSRPDGRARDVLDELEAEVDARMAAPSTRAVSREQGRRWWRSVLGTWPDACTRLEAGLLAGRHGWVVTGAGCAALGLGARDAALIAVYDLVGAPMWAAVRLLGLDPVAASSSVSRLLARFGSDNRAGTDAAERTARLLTPPVEQRDWSWVAWSTAPMSDLGSEAHVQREDRLFAS